MGESHVEGFQSAFLHELGHVLYSDHPPGEPLIDEERMATLAETLPGRAHELGAHPDTRIMLNQIGEILEDARIERRLIDRFRGARRYLAGHVAEALDAARGPVGQAPERPGPSAEPGAAVAPELARLVALLFLQIWGVDDQVAADQLSPRLSEAAARLRSPLLSAVSTDDPSIFADWLITDLLVEMAGSFPEAIEATAAEPGGSKGTGGLPGAAARDRTVAQGRTPRGARRDGTSDRRP